MITDSIYPLLNFYNDFVAAKRYSKKTANLGFANRLP